MIGMLIVAHGDLAQAMLSAVRHVMGDPPHVRAIGLEPNDDLASRRSEIEAAAAALDQGAGVVIVTDLFGGTPANLAIAAMASGDIDVISGVNLPVLMRLLEKRDLPRREAVTAAVEAGRKYILDAAAVLGAQPPAST